ncbi:hypothetical protein OIO90_002061 [Microbotryomycetes sp. JL221]|nr:hypothetical protein OIO90_002061 [Microbotryomycetes sp. JL221]
MPSLPPSKNREPGLGAQTTAGSRTTGRPYNALFRTRTNVQSRVPVSEMMTSPNFKHEMAPALHKPGRGGSARGAASSNGEASVTFAQAGTKNKLRVMYAKIKRRIGNGSAPDDSLGDPTNTTDSENGSSFGGRRSLRSKEGGLNEKDDLVEDVVDEVVVEATGSPEFWKGATQRSDRSRGDNGTGTGGTNGITGTGMQSDSSSLRHTYDAASGMLASVGGFIRWRLYPVVLNFFAPRYMDPSVEDAYQKELWYTSKSSAIFGCMFLTLSWLLGIALLPRPWSRWNEINFYVLGPILNLPLIIMAMLDVPRRRPWVWQPWIFSAIAVPTLANLIDMKLCGFYGPAQLRTCGTKDFQSTLYFATGTPVIGLFACYLRRFPALVIVLTWIVCVAGLILPDRKGYARNLVNVILFHGFFIWSHYMREMADRRMYTMRAELKIQFKAKQKAQINERKTMDSKRRFSSYIFHEVRVPLNTALLAVQNLQATNAFDKASDSAVEYAALEGSLQMMSQVLNDVLDFSRMERGGFLSVSRPFSFHQVIQSIFTPLRIDTVARGLSLETVLDPRIDDVAKKAALPDEDSVTREGDGWMMGDEMRLRQVVNNLTSNACKFTPVGGKISIRTTLVYPVDGLQRLDANELTSDGDGDEISDSTVTGLPSPRLSETQLQQHEAKMSPRSDSVIVVRIEVQDTGVGLRSRDMAENRLFSAYVQTEIGRKQGGKGTGLGLSLVRQIVMLSGGRLGVKSKLGEGSIFWVEMPYKIGTEECRREIVEPRRRTSSTGDRKGFTPSPASESSDLRFMPSLSNRASDSGLKSIDEGTPSLSPLSPPPSFMALEGGQPLGPPEPSPPAPPLPDMIEPHRPTNQHTLSSSSAPPALPPPPPVKTSKALEFDDGPLRVLVVDDDALTRRLMGRMLERLGCLVSTAENGAIALDMLLSGSGLKASSEGVGIDPRSTLSSNAPRNFEITFLDNQMPICSGLQVVNRMRSLGRDDLIVGVTANALLADQENYIEQGASAVLTKPVSEVDLRRYLIMADRKRAELKDPSLRSPIDSSSSPSIPMLPPPTMLREED